MANAFNRMKQLELTETVKHIYNNNEVGIKATPETDNSINETAMMTKESEERDHGIMGEFCSGAYKYI